MTVNIQRTLGMPFTNCYQSTFGNRSGESIEIGASKKIGFRLESQLKEAV